MHSRVREGVEADGVGYGGVGGVDDVGEGRGVWEG